MEFRQHGWYSLEWRGQVLVFASHGVWNDVCSRNLHEDAKSMGHPGGDWAFLCDCSQWEGTTPEGKDAWWQFFEGAVGCGLKAMADIMPSALHGMMVDDVITRCKALVQHRRCADTAEALAWLATLGYSTEPRVGEIRGN